MAIEAINSMGVGSTSVQTGSRQVTVPEAKEATVQVNQAVGAANAAVITKVGQQGAETGYGEGGSQRKPSERTIKQAVSDLNRKINHNTVAEFGYHEPTNRVTIKIVDKDTKEVIKEVPPEKTLEMIAKVWEIAGILVDERK